MGMVAELLSLDLYFSIQEKKKERERDLESRFDCDFTNPPSASEAAVNNFYELIFLPFD